MLTALLALLISVTPAQIVSAEMTRCPDATYMDFREGKKVWDYATGLELRAFLDAYTQAESSRAAFDYVDHWYDAMIDENGVPYGYRLERYNIDHICPGRTLIPLYKATGKEKYRKAMELLQSQLATQPRTVEGGYWHKGIYPNQIWLDGLFMGEPFLVEYAAAFSSPERFREACAESMHQFLTAARVTYDPQTGLLRHAYDASRQMFWCDPVTGQSAHCWARALGWFCMAAVEVLDIVPEDTPGRDSLVTELRRIIGVIPEYADKKTGMWYQVMDQPGRKGNYLEASSSAMFTYAVLKGVRIGVLDASLLEYGKRCWENLLKTFVTVDKQGLVNLNRCCTVGGLGGKAMRKGDFAYYISEPIKSNDPKGTGPFLWASLEMARIRRAEQAMTEEALEDALREKPYRAAGGLHVYEVPDLHDTPAPRGYKPFYISHLSRHGSRTQTSEVRPFLFLATLDSLKEIGLLRPAGDSLLRELHLIQEAHQGRAGVLTQVGEREQNGVGRRMARRYPTVFRRKDAKRVACSSTTVPRCQKSMECFSDGLKDAVRGVDVQCSVGLKLGPEFPQDIPLIPTKQITTALKEKQREFLAVLPCPDSLMHRILVKPEEFSAHLGDRLNLFFYQLFEASAGAQCLEVQTHPLRFFTTEELYRFWRAGNLYYAGLYGTAVTFRATRMRPARRMMRHIVQEADAALDGGEHCADLRFAHDGNIGPLLNALGVEGFEQDTPDESTFFSWQSWKDICMCSNLQMIFYRNKSGDVLVKLLRNEQETLISALPAVSGPYYRWKDLRGYMLSKAGETPQP